MEDRHLACPPFAHLLSTIIGTSLSWPYKQGKLVFGRWQGLYFIELDGPRERKITVYVVP